MIRRDLGATLALAYDSVGGLEPVLPSSGDRALTPITLADRGSLASTGEPLVHALYDQARNEFSATITPFADARDAQTLVATVLKAAERLHVDTINIAVPEGFTVPVPEGYSPVLSAVFPVSLTRTYQR